MTREVAIAKMAAGGFARPGTWRESGTAFALRSDGRLVRIFGVVQNGTRRLRSELYARPTPAVGWVEVTLRQLDLEALGIVNLLGGLPS